VVAALHAKELTLVREFVWEEKTGRSCGRSRQEAVGCGEKLSTWVRGAITSASGECVLRRPDLVSWTAKQATVARGGLFVGSLGPTEDAGRVGDGILDQLRTALGPDGLG
jgi:hypothetical protein